MKINKTLIAVIAGSAVLAGCAADDPNRRAKTGAAVGAIVGGVLGHQIDGDKGRFIGAAAGAMTGAAVGDYMDKQEQEMKAALEAERRRNELEVERLKDESLKVSMNNEVSFDFDSASIKPSFRPTLNKVVDVVHRFERTNLHVVGHTDSVGSADYNRTLSRRRAQAVADYLANQGIAASRITTEGRGESEPRTTNATEAGRQLNRRVELIIRPIEG